MTKLEFMQLVAQTITIPSVRQVAELGYDYGYEQGIADGIKIAKEITKRVVEILVDKPPEVQA